MHARLIRSSLGPDPHGSAPVCTGPKFTLGIADMHCIVKNLIPLSWHAMIHLIEADNVRNSMLCQGIHVFVRKYHANVLRYTHCSHRSCIQCYCSHIEFYQERLMFLDEGLKVFPPANYNMTKFEIDVEHNELYSCEWKLTECCRFFVLY